LKNLIKEKDPAEVILLIHQWEYNQLDDTKKAHKHLHYAWSDLGGKKEVDSYELTEKDKKVGGNFEKFLYQTAIGKITESSLKKPTEQQESPDDNSQTTEPPKWYAKWGYFPIWGTILGVVSVGGLLWWKWNDWFGEKKEEEVGETGIEGKETSEDDQEE